MRYVLITGTNRGIGLELTRQYAQNDVHIIATARDTGAKELQALVSQHPQQITVVPLDVTDAESIAQAVKQIQGITSKIDLLILNAAINPTDQSGMIETISADTLRQAFEVNTIAPLMLTQAFLPLLRQSESAKIVYLLTGMGSLSRKTYPDANAYCISKAAVNMVMRGAAAEFKQDGITAISMDPGWVKTDMGGPHAVLEPQVAVEGIIRVIDGLTTENSGQFLTWDGQQNDW